MVLFMGIIISFFGIGAIALSILVLSGLKENYVSGRVSSKDKVTGWDGKPYSYYSIFFALRTGNRNTGNNPVDRFQEHNTLQVLTKNKNFVIDTKSVLVFKYRNGSPKLMDGPRELFNNLLSTIQTKVENPYDYTTMRKVYDQYKDTLKSYTVLFNFPLFVGTMMQGHKFIVQEHVIQDGEKVYLKIEKGTIKQVSDLLTVIFSRIFYLLFGLFIFGMGVAMLIGAYFQIV